MRRSPAVPDVSQLGAQWALPGRMAVRDSGSYGLHADLSATASPMRWVCAKRRRSRHDDRPAAVAQLDRFPIRGSCQPVGIAAAGRAFSAFRHTTTGDRPVMHRCPASGASPNSPVLSPIATGQLSVMLDPRWAQYPLALPHLSTGAQPMIDRCPSTPQCRRRTGHMIGEAPAIAGEWPAPRSVVDARQLPVLCAKTGLLAVDLCQDRTGAISSLRVARQATNERGIPHAHKHSLQLPM